jgi:ATP-dependent DNA helicase RecG
VSTTVIEVGVDVPDATVMIIENAERFGLSQLHQLRGRVGRSDKQSYCILIAEAASKETRERLNIMVQTNNGFIIAEKDLQIRGPGEFMGTRQSGIPDLLLADITQDTEILEMAREAAFKLIEKDDIKNYPQLLNVVTNKIDEGLDLIKAG